MKPIQPAAGLPTEDDKYRLQTVEKALSILELFYDTPELGAAEAAARLGISRSTAFRFLVTLEHGGLIEKMKNNKYRLALKLFTLGQLAYGRNDLGAAAHAQLEKLAALTEETAHLTVLDGLTHVIFMDKALSRSNLRMDVPVGSRYAAHSSAGGKAILAFQPRALRERYLAAADFTRVTEHSITEPQELIAILSQVRKLGYGVDNEEAEPGLTCFGVPILGAGGISVAGVSVSGPTTRMYAKQEEILRLLKQTAAEVSATLR